MAVSIARPKAGLDFTSAGTSLRSRPSSSQSHWAATTGRPRRQFTQCAFWPRKAQRVKRRSTSAVIA